MHSVRSGYPIRRWRGIFVVDSTREDINALMEAFNGVRRRIWSCQPEEFFDEAKTDADGTLLETLGEV